MVQSEGVYVEATSYNSEQYFRLVPPQKKYYMYTLRHGGSFALFSLQIRKTVIRPNFVILEFPVLINWYNGKVKSTSILVYKLLPWTNNWLHVTTAVTEKKTCNECKKKQKVYSCLSENNYSLPITDHRLFSVIIKCRKHFFLF